MPADASTPGGGLGCLLRLFWMVIGNLLLVLAVIAVAQAPSDKLVFGDILFWVVVALMVGCRWADVRLFQGTRADGTPASPSDLRRYILILAAGGGLLWLAIRLGKLYV